nr:type I polyketide synthase [Anaerocolumna cellulosilytica]
MSGRFPRARNLEEFWDNIIKNGADAVGRFPKSRMADITPILHRIDNAEKVEYRCGAYLEDINNFDYQFFQMSLREAKLMDPNQRIFLQTAWEAIEDAGYGGKCLTGSSTGIYLGYSSDMNIEYKSAIHLAQSDMEGLALAGNIKSIIASRLAYILDLRGPSMLIDTACSSSLVAVHAACQAIRNKECDQAVTGSIKICLAPFLYDDEASGVQILSLDGRAKTFDDNADGTGLGEGVAAIMLKRLDKALSDGDRIYAVIKGSAVNQDGSSIGITAPNPLAQEQVILKAWEDAGINPSSISYIEAHGTGTPLGDPIEIDAISSAFRKYTEKKQFCAVSSVKTNIGHLDNASGIAGLIKVVLALQNRKLPATINYRKPNRNINFEESSVYINDKTSEWEVKEHPRRAGVSSFGLSGTNCHMVLEEAPDTKIQAKNVASTDSAYILALSAKSLESLNSLIGEYLNFLKHSGHISMGDLCYTANTGRGHYSHRLVLMFDNKDMLMKSLEGLQIIGELNDDERGLFYKEHKVVRVKDNLINIEGITEAEKFALTTVANDKIKRLMYDGNVKSSEILKELCKLYINGAEINWTDFFKNKMFKRIKIPFYPFLKQRVWLDTGICSDKNKADTNRNTSWNNFYKMSWRKCPLSVSEPSMLIGTTLVFYKEKNSFIERLIKYIEALGSKCVVISMINDSFQTTIHGYSISSKAEHYIKLMNTLSQHNINNILFTDIKENEVFETGSYKEELAVIDNENTYNLFYLTKSLLEAGLTSRIKMLVLSNNAYKVKDEVIIRPDSASLFGFARVIKNEYPNLMCKCIDISESTELRDILRELNTDELQSQVIYRNGERYIEELDILDLDLLENAKIQIREQGVYIITGGVGGIGLEIAKYLSSQNKVKLAMINRTAFPLDIEWEEILRLKKDEKICRKIEKLKEIQSFGSEVRLHCADVSDENAMREVIYAVRAEWGRINGVIHCAGIAGKDFIFRKNESQFAEVLKPKVAGTLILDKLTCRDELDLFVLFSSNSSFLAEAGQGDYAAANSFMDAYSIYRRLKGKRTITINWPAWKEIGMALDYGVNKDGAFKAITTGDAITAFAKVLEKDVSNVIVAELNCENISLNDLDTISVSERVKLLINNERVLNQKAMDSISTHSKTSTPVEMKGRKNSEYNEAESIIAQIWGDVLEMKEVNIYESFHDLGGDSISASILVQKINKEYPNVLNVVDIYTYPTVVQMAEFVAATLQQNKNKKNEIIFSEEDSLMNTLRSLRTGEVSLDESLEILNKEWYDD